MLKRHSQKHYPSLSSCKALVLKFLSLCLHLPLSLFIIRWPNNLAIGRSRSLYLSHHLLGVVQQSTWCLSTVPTQCFKDKSATLVELRVRLLNSNRVFVYIDCRPFLWRSSIRRVRIEPSRWPTHFYGSGARNAQTCFSKQLV